MAHSNVIINTTFNIIGAAEAAANLLCEFKIAEKKDAKLINNIKGNVILVKSVAKINFSGSDLKPGAISDTNKGMNNSMRITSPSSEKVNKLKTLFAKFSEFFLDLVNSFAYLGTKAALKEPSPKILLNVFGILNATKKASAITPEPRNIAIRMSLKYPDILLIRV